MDSRYETYIKKTRDPSFWGAHIEVNKAIQEVYGVGLDKILRQYTQRAAYNAAVQENAIELMRVFFSLIDAGKINLPEDSKELSSGIGLLAQRFEQEVACKSNYEEGDFYYLQIDEWAQRELVKLFPAGGTG